MLPDFVYRGYFDPGQVRSYIDAKEVLKECSKEERVSFVKKITGYVSQPHSRDGAFLFSYRDLLLGRRVRLDDWHEILSDDEIDAIAPYLFDDLDFLQFCCDIFLSLVPLDDQGTEVEVKYESRENRKTTPPPDLISLIRGVASIFSTSDQARHLRYSKRLQDAVTIVTAYREDGKLRYEYHRGTIGEYFARDELLLKRQAEKKEKEKQETPMPVQVPECLHLQFPIQTTVPSRLFCKNFQRISAKRRNFHRHTL